MRSMASAGSPAKNGTRLRIVNRVFTLHMWGSANSGSTGVVRRLLMAGPFTRRAQPEYSAGRAEIPTPAAILCTTPLGYRETEHEPLDIALGDRNSNDYHGSYSPISGYHRPGGRAGYHARRPVHPERARLSGAAGGPAGVAAGAGDAPRADTHPVYRLYRAHVHPVFRHESDRPP